MITFACCPSNCLLASDVSIAVMRTRSPILSKFCSPFLRHSSGILRYSPECVELELCELRLLGILRSSHTPSSKKFGYEGPRGTPPLCQDYSPNV